MRARRPIRMKNMWPAGVCAFSLLLPALARPQSGTAQSAPVVLDRVVAVVNQRVILASDLDEEVRLSVLDPGNVGLGPLTRQRALEQLISRSLLEQQIRQEDEQSTEPPQSEIDARLAELRKELPACVQEKCATDAGWQQMLAEHNLTAQRVVAYLRYRLEILRFIEQRFRPGIRITQDQIADYYNKTLIPQYRPGDTVPTLEQVAPRIEEVLLEQQVNVLFDNWLKNLRQQGDVEILDPALEMPDQLNPGGGK
jgi:peptidyl-prolyl cis-trans isomerase SurA